MLGITRECCCYWNREMGYMDHWSNQATYLCSLKKCKLLRLLCAEKKVLKYKRGGETAQCAAAIIKLSMNKDSYHYHQFCSSIKFFIHKSPRIIQMFSNEVTDLFPTHFQMSWLKKKKKRQKSMLLSQACCFTIALLPYRRFYGILGNI